MCIFFATTMTYEICTDVVVDLAYQKLAPSNEPSRVRHNEVLVLLLLILLFNTMVWLRPAIDATYVHK